MNRCFKKQWFFLSISETVKQWVVNGLSGKIIYIILYLTK